LLWVVHALLFQILLDHCAFGSEFTFELELLEVTWALKDFGAHVDDWRLVAKVSEVLEGFVMKPRFGLLTRSLAWLPVIVYLWEFHAKLNKFNISLIFVDPPYVLLQGNTLALLVPVLPRFEYWKSIVKMANR